MNYGEKVAIVCCSNGQKLENRNRIEELMEIITQIGLVPVLSEYIFEKENCFSGTAKERAESLMNFYRDDEIRMICDISGGDLANEILPYLDFDLISNSDKLFWGYSDLTTIINAIYAKTGKKSILYQIRNLIYDDSERQIANFKNTVLDEKKDLFHIKYEFIQGTEMKGAIVGGNIRCLLKLAGTLFFPDMEGKILLLEAYSGKVPQMVTFLSQLKLMGVFEKIHGILLGTYTEMEKTGCTPHMKELILNYIDSDLPVAYTKEIGHGVDSKAIVIGDWYEF